MYLVDLRNLFFNFIKILIFFFRIKLEKFIDKFIRFKICMYFFFCGEINCKKCGKMLYFGIFGVVIIYSKFLYYIKRDFNL